MSSRRYSDNLLHEEDKKDFEKGRIRALQDERLSIQKKTFTKWVNSFLIKSRMEINDLFTDLGDGKYLMRLLEIISGERLGKPNSGKMRVHKIENVNKCLAFLHTKVRLESIGAEDIVDGNPRLILGLIWTIILRFQIQEIEIRVDEDEEQGEKKSAKEALMMWCQRNTRGYKDVHIRDFTSSWRDGMAFNAMLHNQNPDCMNFSKLHPSNHLENLKHAFDVAESRFGVHKLLDPEDVDVQRPDEKSIMTYIASFYHTFSKLNEGQRGGKKITFIISKIKRIEDQQRQYEVDSKALLEWISEKTELMKNRSYANTIDGIQQDFKNFKSYTTKDKPPKCKEKVNIEASFFEIDVKLKELRQPPYVPSEGHRLSDIDQAWKALEKEEHLQETALRSELMRLERLEQLAAKFNQKVGLRNSYLDEMIQVLSDPRYGANLFNVEASLKKHEAISADILSREDRFKEIEKLMAHLDKENYHDKAPVLKLGGELLKKWQHLMNLLEQHQHKLEIDNQMLSHLRDLETVHASVISLMETFASEEFQKATNIDESMQKLNLLESEVNAIADSIRKLKSASKRFTTIDDNDLKKNVTKKLETLEKDYDELVAFAKTTRQRFEDIQCVQQIRHDLDDVHHWLTEKTAVTMSPSVVKDLNALSLQLEKHKTWQNEFKKWYKKYESTQQSLKKFGLTNDEAIVNKVKAIDGLWDELKNLMKDRELKLAALFSALNLNSDLNDAESWLKDVHSIVSATDVGTDEVTCQALNNRHKEVSQQIKHFESELQKLTNAHDKYLREVPNATTKRKVVEQRRVPQVRAIYSYSGHGVDVVKGELMFLLAKSNKDWWNVRTASGTDGFVPANYVKEVEPKTVQVEVAKEIEHFKTGDEDLSPVALEGRLTTLKDLYNTAVAIADEKHANLENSMKLFAFKAQCERVKYWLSERQRDLISIKNTQESSLKVDEICKSISGYESNVTHLRNEAKRLAEEIPSRRNNVHQALQEVEKLWANLDSIRQTSERKIINSVQLEKFKKTCADTIDWIQEKLLYIDSLDSMFTVNALDNMIRRHKGLKREMIPIKERIDEVRASYANVKRTFNEEANAVAPNVDKMITLFNQLVEKLEHKEEELARLARQQKFEKMSKEYVEWANAKLRQLERNPVQDLAFADESKVLIEELDAEIERKADDYEEILGIGNALEDLEADEKLVNELQQVQTLTENLKSSLAAQTDYIRRIDEYKLFSQESRAIESHISSCKRLLFNFDSNLSEEELDDMSKRHNLLAAMIESYEERVKKFLDSASQLNPEEHIKYEECMHKKDAIARDWEALNEDCAKCQAKLLDHKTFLDLALTIDEMEKFIAEKEKLIQDVSYRDPSHLRTKLKKHEALDGEVKAHGSEMKLIKLRVDKLAEEGHPHSDAIAEKFNALTDSWEQLSNAIHGKYDFIKESLIDVDVTNGIDSINSKITVLSKDLSTPVEIQDVKHCNQQIAKHKSNYAAFKQLENKFKTLEADASDVDGGKQNKKELQQSLAECYGSLDALKPAFDQHISSLQKSLKFHEMMSELNTELQWVKEKEKLILMGEAGKGLMQVRSQTKRHRSLEEEVSNHLPVLYELIERASGYNDESKKKVVDDACSVLAEAAEELQVKLAERANELELSVKIFTLIEEINEIEHWIEIKRPMLEAPIEGKDEDTILLYLTKQKAVELELDSYSGIISEVTHNAQALSQSKHPLIAQLKHRDQSLSQEILALQKTTRGRRNALMTQLQYHEFVRECDDLRKWMREQAVIAASQDLGQDFEHLETLMAKYDTLRQEVANGKEKLDGCISLAQRMKGAEIAAEVNGMKDACVIEWDELLKMVRLRGQKLEAAGEIHKFNRDIAEALLRIQEKSSYLGNEQVKDIKSIERLLRQQDIFDNDLVALRGQLQTLEDDSDKLQNKYPGPNAEHIAEQLEIVQANWEELQEKAKLHRQMLVSNLGFQKFLLKCQDLLTWCSHLKIMLLSEEKVTSVAEAQLLKSEHENLKNEISAKEDNFKELVEIGNSMKQQKGHAFGDEIEAKQAQVLEERTNLHMAWQQKKIYIEQLLDLQYFLRDTKQITAFMTAQERAATRTINVEDIETIDKELKFFENNAVKLKNFEERTKVLHKHGKKLVDQNHFDSNFIKRSVAEILQFQEKVLDATRGREIYLKHMKTSLEFQRDVLEVETWMSDKMDKFSKASKEYEQGSLGEKIKFLQKYTVFENEVSKHQVIIDGIVAKGELLINSNHNVDETKVKLQSLLKLWADLKALSEQIRKELQDALDLYNFETEIDEIEATVREKEYMSNVSDVGKDLEHCKDLLHKLSETDAEMNVHEKFERALRLAKKVEGSKMSADADKAHEKLDRVTKKWNSIQDCIENYRKTLNEALLAHQLTSDMLDVTDIIAEKKTALTFDTKALSEATTDKVYQKCVTIQDFIKTLEPKIAEFGNRRAKLMSNDHPALDSEKVNSTYENLTKEWQACLDFSVSQLGLVTRHEELMKSMKVINDQKRVLQSTVDSMESQAYPNVVSEVDVALTKHVDLRASLQIQQDILKSSMSKLQESQPEEVDDTAELFTKQKEELENVSQLATHCDASWHQVNEKLLQSKEYLNIHLKLVEISSWIENADTLLKTLDASETTTGDIDALLRKQTTFERSLQQQQKEFMVVKKEAEQLIARDNFRKDEIILDLDQVELGLQNLQEKNATFILELKGLRSCRIILRRVNEMRSWMKEKLHVALDESYLELTNILSKLQRHSVLESEIAANAERMFGVEKEVSDVSKDASIPANIKKDVIQQMEELSAEWNHLRETAKSKQIRLLQANKAVEFVNNVDEIIHWLKEADEVLRNDDLGKDVESVIVLLKKHATVEAELCQKETQLEDLKKTSVKFEQDNHFAHSVMSKKVQDAMETLEKLQSQAIVLKENLEDSMVYHSYVKDIHDALLWIKEKIALVSVSDFGKSLVEVQSMMKRHQLLEVDVANHNSSVKSLIEKGEQLVRSNHQQGPEIEKLVEELARRRNELRDAASLRKLRLDDAVQSQQFFIQCHEINSWIIEKDLLVSQKIHIDNDFIQSLLKRIEGLETELVTHKVQVQELQEEADLFVKRGHFESAEITQQMEAITTAFDDLLAKVKSQKEALVVKRRLYQFFRDSEEMEDWISSQLTVASSEDYGKDLDDVDRLIHNFDLFLTNLTTHEDKLTHFNTFANELINDVHDQEIEGRTREVRSLWDDLMELAGARKEALVGAKKVHSFDKRIDDTLDWILEKEALLTIDVNCQDEETIQEMKQKQLGIRQDVKAINEQVMAVNKDADVLVATYPDAVDHIVAKRRELLRAVEKLDDMVKHRDSQLEQNGQLLDYHSSFRDLMTWANEFLARMCNPELSKDLHEASTIYSRHGLLHDEMVERGNDFARFEDFGRELIDNGHYMSQDIQEKVSSVSHRKKTLMELWTLRNSLYEQHIDYLKWLKEINDIESWLGEKEPEVSSNEYGNNFDDLDKLMIKQLEMEEALLNKEEKINQIKRITLIETEFKALKAKEEEARREDEQRQENERLEAIKKKEMARRTREKKREDERRRTQEIVLPPSHVLNKEVTKAENDIPRFNTRRSLRQGPNNRWKMDSSNMPPVTMEGFLERKQQSNSGGKRSTIRSWKNYYTVISGQLLCFFKDQGDFKDWKAAAAPLFLHNATCEKALDYTKKKHVIRLVSNDGSEFLFQAANRESQEEWLQKLVYTSNLEPSESVKKSTLARPSLAPPDPPMLEDVPHDDDGNEPLYANMAAVSQNSDAENHPENDGAATSDNSYMSNEVDGKEKRGGRLSKFLGLRPKISTS